MDCQAFIIAISSAYYVFLKYAKLWELTNIIRLNASDALKED